MSTAFNCASSVQIIFGGHSMAEKKNIDHIVEIIENSDATYTVCRPNYINASK